MHAAAKVTPEGSFLPTRPPPSEADLYTAEWIAARGVSFLRSATVEPVSGVLLAHWYVDEDGYTGVDAGRASSVEFPMRTVDELRATPHAETAIRRVSGRRWELAWRVSNGQFCVAMLHYQLQRKTLNDDNDLAQIKLLCEKSLNGVASISGTAPQAPPRSTPTPKADGLKLPAHSETQPWIGDRAEAPGGRTATAPLGRLRWLAVALLLLGAVGTALFTITGRQGEAIQEQTLRHRLQVESTISSRLGEKLAQGDYGEVQSELDSFRALGYFEDAVVTNSQQRVVALSGRLTGVRIGGTVPLELASKAKVMSLGILGQSGRGQAMTWALPGSGSDQASLQRTLLAWGVGVCGTAVFVAAWVLALLRRRQPQPT